MPGIKTMSRIVSMALILGTVCAALASEAPRYYDPLGPQGEYDPDLFPLNRPVGTMDFFFQWASRPTATDPEGTVFKQLWTDEYRFRWHASLEPEWALFIEAKGARRSQVLPEDYFLKFDMTYQGLSSPILPYGGMRIHKENEWIGYLGLETMGFRLRDILGEPDQEYAPLALRGWAEMRYTEEIDTPSFRLMALINTLPEFSEAWQFSMGMDHRFNEQLKPEWLASFQTRYFLTSGLARIMLHGGYEYDLRMHTQRASLGFGINAF